MLIAQVLKFMIDKIYWTSPYRWLDEWLKHLENKPRLSRKNWEKLRQRRYLIAEMYFILWFGVAVLVLVFNQWLPVILAYIFLLRIVGIINKELGVVLFGICKITEGKSVSSSGRVISNAFLNYLTAGLLFAFLYSKSGLYQAYTAAPVSLTIYQAIIQSFSIQFTLSPAFSPADTFSWIFIIGQSAFCFLFGTIIIAMFVSLINLKSETENDL